MIRSGGKRTLEICAQFTTHWSFWKVFVVFTAWRCHYPPTKKLLLLFHLLLFFEYFLWIFADGSINWYFIWLTSTQKSAYCSHLCAPLYSHYIHHPRAVPHKSMKSLFCSSNMVSWMLPNGLCCIYWCCISNEIFYIMVLHSIFKVQCSCFWGSGSHGSNPIFNASLDRFNMASTF